MAIAMVALLAFGGTYAYFTATATEKIGTLKTGTIKLATGGDFLTANTIVMPKQSLLAENNTITVTPTTTGDSGEYIAVRITVTFKDSNGTTIALADGDTLEDIVAITMPENTWVKASEGVYVYCTTASATTTTSATKAVSGTPVTVASAIVFNAEDDWDQDNADSSTKGYMGATIEVKIEARGIQTVENTEFNTVATVATKLFG